MSDEAVIHLRVPAATKAAWVRESRAAGMRLTDWIVSRIEAKTMPQQIPKATTICIPADLAFSDLKMARDPDGMVSFDTSVISRIEAASGLPDGFFMEQDESALSELITNWYRAHLAAGGAPDPVQEDLIEEARLEDLHGAGFSHAPGSA